MTLQDFRKLYNTRPFRPFALHLADGREVSVVPPDFAAVSRAGRGVVVISPDNTQIGIVDLLLATNVVTTILPSGELPAPPTANGDSRDHGA